MMAVELKDAAAQQQEQQQQRPAGGGGAAQPAEQVPPDEPPDSEQSSVPVEPAVQPVDQKPAEQQQEQPPAGKHALTKCGAGAWGSARPRLAAAVLLLWGAAALGCRAHSSARCCRRRCRR